MEDDRPTASRLADAEDNDEDGLPDWSQFAKLRASQKTGEGVFIPKRGEKDFEPIAAPSTSDHLTLAEYQSNQLINSRNALFSAISSGTRHHGSKAHNCFTWRGSLDGGRATCDGASYGVHFGSMGLHNAERKRLELLPEEALYLVERGAIELWNEADEVARAEGEERVRVPMSVQQTWSEVMGADELTMERYQVYSYLRRLGYIVTRARALAPTPARAPKPIPYSLLQLVRAPFLAMRSWLLRVLTSAKQLRFGSASETLRLGITRTLQSYEGQFSALISGRRWATYSQMFARLQIVPSGHDTSLSRGPAPHVPNVLVPVKPVEAHPELPSLETNPYQPFFHVYRPSTKFRKSAPPEPDFRLVVINSNTTPMPDMFEFDSMFSSAPMPTPSTLSAAPAPKVNSASSPAASKQKPSRPPARARAPPPQAKPTRFRKLVSRIPYAEKLLPPLGPAKKTFAGPNKAVLYTKLKTGRRFVLVAIVDNGTSSFIKFNESEFAKMPWTGGARSA